MTWYDPSPLIDHNIMLVTVGVAGTMMISLLYVLWRRSKTLRQRDTEGRIMMQTRDYLLSHAAEYRLRDLPPERAVGAGRWMTARHFKDIFAGAAAPLPEANPTVFGAFPHSNAVRIYCERQADLAATRLIPVTMPLSELLPATVGAQGFGVSGGRQGRRYRKMQRAGNPF